MFKRTGTPAKVDIIDTYDETKETEIVCPTCKCSLGKKSNKLIKLGGATFLGVKQIYCSTCHKEVK